MQIVDTHQHLWDLDKFRLPWLADEPTLGRCYLPADYAEATRGLGVTHSVYMEVDAEPSQQAEEARYVIDLCEKGETTMCGAVISGRPASDGFREYLAPFRDNPWIKGVRQVLHRPEITKDYWQSPPFVAGIRYLGDIGLSFDLCLRSDDLLEGAPLVDACPKTRFILDHCGNADVKASDLSRWRQGITELAKRDNLVCKVSGIIASAPSGWKVDQLEPIVNHTLDSFGPDRVMFGGDWPVCTLGATYRQWVEALQQIVRDRPEADQRKLFAGNALKFYSLKS